MLNKTFLKAGIKSSLFKQSALGMLFNVLSVLFSVVTISFLLKYLGKNDYGIWLTIFSICSWISFLDGGFGNGLRNELTLNLVKKNIRNAREIISTGYISIFIFLSLLYFILFFIHFFFDWNSIVSSNAINFNFLALFVFGFFMLQMVLKIIGKIYFSFNKSYLSFLIPMVSNLVILLLVLVINFNDFGNKFWNVALIYSFAPLLVIVILSLHFFIYMKPEYAPSIKFFNKNYVSVILKNGSLFFLIQMSSGILRAITPFFITLWFLPALTAEYQIAIKYYSFVVILLNILLQTMWNDITTTYLKKDVKKLKLIFKRKIIIAFVLISGLFIMYLGSNYVYELWIGKDISISKTINFACFLFVVSVIIANIFTNFLNATNNIKIQAVLSIIIIILYIPLAYTLVNVFDLGVASLIFAPTVFFIIQIFVAIYELRRIVFIKDAT